MDFVHLDVRDADAVRAGIGAVLDRSRRIDLLVNNAGVGLVGAAEETSADEARALFETNFFATVSLTSAVTNRAGVKQARRQCA